MQRPSLIAFVFALSLTCTTASAEPIAAPDTRIRTTDDVVARTVSTVRERSAAFRSLCDIIEASNVVVYVERRPIRSADTAARVSFISSAGGRRYLSVVVDPKFDGQLLVRLLAHELRHVVEIADVPSIVDERSLARFYRVIGTTLTVDGSSERFETDAAIETAERVSQELAEYERSARSARLP